MTELVFERFCCKQCLPALKLHCTHYVAVFWQVIGAIIAWKGEDTPYRARLFISDDSCTNNFTPNQVARMHCYVDLVYQNWVVSKKPTPIPLPPMVIGQSSESVTIHWLPPVSGALHQRYEMFFSSMDGCCSWMLLCFTMFEDCVYSFIRQISLWTSLSAYLSLSLSLSFSLPLCPLSLSLSVLSLSIPLYPSLSRSFSPSLSERVLWTAGTVRKTGRFISTPSRRRPRAPAIPLATGLPKRPWVSFPEIPADTTHNCASFPVPRSCPNPSTCLYPRTCPGSTWLHWHIDIRAWSPTNSMIDRWPNVLATEISVWGRCVLKPEHPPLQVRTNSPNKTETYVQNVFLSYTQLISHRNPNPSPNHNLSGYTFLAVLAADFYLPRNSTTVCFIQNQLSQENSVGACCTHQTVWGKKKKTNEQLYFIASRG